MNRVANFTAEQRKSLFLETGNAIGLDVNLVEKDFWVCWTLKQYALLKFINCYSD